LAPTADEAAVRVEADAPVPTPNPLPLAPDPLDPEQRLREAYLEFEAAFRREHPVIWWCSLVGPVVVSAAVVLVVYLVSGAAYTWRLLAMVAAAMWFFGRFVILGGHDPDVSRYTGGMTPGELFWMVTYLDVMVALLLALHVGYLFRLPLVGRRIATLFADARFILSAQPWMKRAALAGLVAFVGFPFQATGSIGGSLMGRVLGLGRVATFGGIVFGSLIGNSLMLLGSDLANVYLDKNHPMVKYSGIVLIAAVIVAMNAWYHWIKRRHAGSGTPAVLHPSHPGPSEVTPARTPSHADEVT
jgi:uncharacterized membrane protein